MTTRAPKAEQAYDAGQTTTTPWAEAREHLEQAEIYWLSTVRSDGAPHTVPVLGVWVDGALHFAASPASRKAKNLAHSPRCTVAANTQGLDLVIEGRATMVRGDRQLQLVADAYASRHGWHVEIRDRAFHAEGAPTAGPPPFHIFAVTPATAFGFPTGTSFVPTRWCF